MSWIHNTGFGYTIKISSGEKKNRSTVRNQKRWDCYPKQWSKGGEKTRKSTGTEQKNECKRGKKKIEEDTVENGDKETRYDKYRYSKPLAKVARDFELQKQEKYNDKNGMTDDVKRPAVIQVHKFIRHVPKPQ